MASSDPKSASSEPAPEGNSNESRSTRSLRSSVPSIRTPSLRSSTRSNDEQHAQDGNTASSNDNLPNGELTEDDGDGDGEPEKPAKKNKTNKKKAKSKAVVDADESESEAPVKKSKGAKKGKGKKDAEGDGDDDDENDENDEDGDGDGDGKKTKVNLKDKYNPWPVKPPAPHGAPPLPPPPNAHWGLILCPPDDEEPRSYPDEPPARTSNGQTNPPLWEDREFPVTAGNRDIIRNGVTINQEHHLVLKLIDMRPMSKNDPTPRRTPIYWANQYGTPKDWSDRYAIRTLNQRRHENIRTICADDPYTPKEAKFIAEEFRQNPNISIKELTERFNHRFRGEYVYEEAAAWDEPSDGRTIESIRAEYLENKALYDQGKPPQKTETRLRKKKLKIGKTVGQVMDEENKKNPRFGKDMELPDEDEDEIIVPKYKTTNKPNYNLLKVPDIKKLAWGRDIDLDGLKNKKQYVAALVKADAEKEAGEAGPSGTGRKRRSQSSSASSSSKRRKTSQSGSAAASNESSASPATRRASRRHSNRSSTDSARRQSTRNVGSAGSAPLDVSPDSSPRSSRRSRTSILSAREPTPIRRTSAASPRGSASGPRSPATRRASAASQRRSFTPRQDAVITSTSRRSSTRSRQSSKTQVEEETNVPDEVSEDNVDEKRSSDSKRRSTTPKAASPIASRRASTRSRQASGPQAHVTFEEESDVVDDKVPSEDGEVDEGEEL